MAEARVNPDLLPFSVEKQRAVLGHILYDDRFFSTVILKIEPEWFGDAILCRIYDALKQWYVRWNKKPSINELLESRPITKLPTAEILQVQTTISYVATSRQTFDIEPLLSEMEIWLKARTIQSALPKAAAAFNSQKLDESIGIMNKMVKEYHDIRFLEDGQVSFYGYGAELMKEKQDSAGALTFGVTAMDRLLEPNGASGSLLPGHMTVLLAPTNVGKTSAMVTIACHNIFQGKSVLFIAHEGTPEELKGKFMRCITGMTHPEMFRAYTDPVLSAKMRGYEEILQRFLVYKPMYKAGLTVEEVAATVETLQDQRRMNTGKGFDLLVDDYGAKLSCMANARGNMQPRQVQEEVYNQFVQMGLHHKFHVLTAIQTNREGSKLNNRIGNQKNETRLLHMEDVQETWGAMTAAAIVISLNRNAKDAELNKITYLICKSRGGETGWAIVCNTDYDRCRLHSNDLGAFSYRGTDSVGEVSSAIMSTWKNKVVTSDILARYAPLGGV